MELKLTMASAGISKDILLEQGQVVLDKADKIGSQVVRTSTATAVEIINGESTLVNTGAKLMGTGIVAKVGASLVEGALGAVGVNVTLDAVHSAGDGLIGAGAVLAGVGVLTTAYSNRKITDEQLVALGKKNAVTDTPSDKEEVKDIEC